MVLKTTQGANIKNTEIRVVEFPCKTPTDNAAIIQFQAGNTYKLQN